MLCDLGQVSLPSGFLPLGFPLWETDFENLQSNFGINDFSLLFTGGKEKQHTQHAMQRVGGVYGLTVFWRRARQEAGRLCHAVCEPCCQGFRLSVLRSSEQEEGKMLSALEKASFWRRRDLSKDLKHESRLGKEASMRKEESGGYE